MPGRPPGATESPASPARSRPPTAWWAAPAAIWLAFTLTALRNGNYVVDSMNWDNGSATDAGAVTWGNGPPATHRPGRAANSLVGTQTGDGVGYNRVLALSNGNYVVLSSTWQIGTAYVGAATWVNGFTGQPTGPVSSPTAWWAAFGAMVSVKAPLLYPTATTWSAAPTGPMARSPMPGLPPGRTVPPESPARSLCQQPGGQHGQRWSL